MASSSAALFTAVIVGFVIFGLGYVWNAFRGARMVLRGAKSGVPKARAAYRHTLWRLIKWMVASAIVAIALVAWTVRDVQDADPAPSPASSVPGR
ncbi:MAG TPA: hypothetical protein VFH03_01620 [Actinoplanes sp.]|nr:hypothetical protein [Actinoplanes sp.]